MATMPGISFEFFPPRTPEQHIILDSTWKILSRLSPNYLSVTFGAGGSAQAATLEAVDTMLEKAGVPVAPHISCMADSSEGIRDLLNEYRARGVDHLVVLRGDRQEGVHASGRFQYASDLVGWVREEFGDDFHIEVACYPEIHPESESLQSEMKYFRQKVEAGANGAITQYFFNPDSYFHFRDDALRMGVDIPITPGIMPITNYKQLARFSNICGAEIPIWIRRRLESYGDDGASIREFGLEVVTSLCEQLLNGGAPGLHFYTLNRANATMRLWQNLTSYFVDKAASKPVRG